jgi:DNA-binding protein H-NS
MAGPSPKVSKNIKDVMEIISRCQITEIFQLEEMISARRAEMQNEVRAQLQADFAKMAANAGLSIKEILGGATGGGVRGSGLPQYQHPDHPELTYSGFGRKPKWLLELLKQGKQPVRVNDMQKAA